ncbi:MAG: hypothetical protein ABJA67_06100 [Chthonomonadales bacterium]
MKQLASRTALLRTIVLSGFLALVMNSGISGRVAAFTVSEVDQQTLQNPTQDPKDKPVANQAPAEDESTTLLKKALAAYTNSKSYSGEWTFTQVRGNDKAEVSIEVKMKIGKKASIRTRPAESMKDVPKAQLPTSVCAVLDGKTAWFENTDDGKYYKVALTKDASFSPLMFFPLLGGTRNVKRLPDISVDGTDMIVLQAESGNDTVNVLVLDNKTYHLKSMSATTDIGGIKSVSTLKINKEVFDAEISDSLFTYRAPKNFKEVPAPPGAAAIFGLPG